VDYFIPLRHEVNLAEMLPPAHREGYIAYVMGASAPTKQLPIHKMVELCLMLKRPIVLVGGKEDATTAQTLIAKLVQEADAPPVLNLAGKLGINQSASVVRQALAVVGHDTGLTHIGAAFHHTVYTLWGCTVPYFGFTPYTAHSVVIENTALKCRPCSRAGAAQCPKGHFKCMNEIDLSPLEILAANK
jgi:heptosyltransferase-2